MFRFIILFTFVTGILIFSQSREFLRRPLNKETFREFDEYIRKYAPSDSAARVVQNLANRHHFAQRSAVAMGICEKYRPFFKDRDQFIDELVKQYEEYMLTQKPQPDTRYLYLNYIMENAPSENAFVAVQRIAQQYIEEKQWDSAIFVMKDMLPIFKDSSSKINDLIRILEAPEQGLRITNPGEAINSYRAEWDPCPSPDGRALFFSASHRPGGYGRSDIWFSIMKNGKWQNAVNIGEPINGEFDETVDNVWVDGNGLMLSGTFEGTFGKFDIYMIKATEEGWSPLEHLPAPINSEHTDEGGNLTADGRAILFSSDRTGGTGEYVPFNKVKHGEQNGNMDIYVSMKTDSGWSETINLGTVINTPYAERAPYLHPDGKTLYFSSSGHGGLGGMDLYVSRRLSEDSWTEWSEPVNLGKEINSAVDDWGYTISLRGDSAFFAARNRPNNYGDWDIYSITLPDEAKPYDVVTISGEVKDANGRKLITRIIWDDLETGEKMGDLMTDPRTGNYFIVLPKGRIYGYYAEKRGYYPTSDYIDLRDVKDIREFKQDIILYSEVDVRKGKTAIPINNIFFEFDKFELKPESYPELKRLSKFLQKNTGYKVQIEGHTDESGSEVYNINLSKLRAESVKNYLVELGHNGGMFITKGYGNKKPISDNSTEVGRAKNRRVEFKLVR